MTGGLKLTHTGPFHRTATKVHTKVSIKKTSTSAKKKHPKATTSGILNIKGTWSDVCSALGTTFPQTWVIMTQNPTTGAFTGTDTGTGSSNPSVFTFTGTLVGRTLNFTTTLASIGYTAKGSSTITGSGTALTATGPFMDSNGTKGSCVAHLVTSGN